MFAPSSVTITRNSSASREPPLRGRCSEIIWDGLAKRVEVPLTTMGEGTSKAGIVFRYDARPVGEADHEVSRVSVRITFSKKLGWGLLASVIGMKSANG